MFKTKPHSSLGIKYPTLRDHRLHTSHQWLEGRRADDGAEGLWRIHNGLYDFTSFVDRHPGGTEWLQRTKGTDITEAFETHHLSKKPQNLLLKFYVREAKSERNLPFTFYEGGFYKTLKRNIGEALENVPKYPADRSKSIADLLISSYIITALAAAHFQSFTVGMISGIFLSLTAIAAHNFFHQKDNFRMYYFDFTLMQSSEWRVSHALSHHLFTNTVNDLEISTLEPLLWYLPIEKNSKFKFLQWIITPYVYTFAFFGIFIRDTIQMVIFTSGFSHISLLRFTVLIAMMAVSQQIFLPLMMFLWIQMMGSLHFTTVGLNAAHHHPDIFHDGDTPRAQTEMDWGIYQLDAVMDRKDITGSHFLVLTNFGDHALHHLFPTIDHGLLEYLYPTFLKTCAQFGIQWRMVSQIDLVKGQFLQLIKSGGKKEPPLPLKKIKVR